MAAVSNDSGHWLPLVEYSAKRGVSLSTLRRQIKARKLRYRLDEGKYFIFDEELLLDDGVDREELHAEEMAELRKEIIKIKKELAEFKMLLALYEEKLAPICLDH